MARSTRLRRLTTFQAGLCLFFTIFTLFHAFSQNPARAQTTQTTGVTLDLESQYQVTPPNITRVTHTLTLKNQNPTVSVTQLVFRIASPQLQHLTVTSSTSDNPTPQDITPVQPVVTQSDTTLSLSLSDSLVGQDKTRRIEITYTDTQLAQFTPFSGYVFLPELINPQTYRSHQVLVSLPSSLKPQEGANLQVLADDKSGEQVTTYQVTDQPSSSQTWYFGTVQPVAFSLEYSLNNTSNGPLSQQVVLPPSTPYQQVWFETLEPKPTHISQDLDGNWLASYQVPAQQTLGVRVTGAAELSRVPRWTQELSHKAWTQEQASWPTQSTTATQWRQLSVSELMTALSELPLAQAPESVTTNLESNLDHQLPLSYNQLLDLVITNLRAGNQPARRVVGLTWVKDDSLRPLSQPDRQLHHWVELWQDHHWQPLDPVWQLTTHGQNYIQNPDLTRLALMYQGTSDQSPQLDNLVKSELTATTQTKVLPLQLNITSRAWRWRGLPLPGWQELQIENQSGRATLQPTLSLTTPDGTTHQVKVPPLLPYQSVWVPVKLSSSKWWQGDLVSVQLQLDEYQTTIHFQRPPRSLSLLFGWPGAILAAAAICGTLGAGSVLVFRRR